MEARHEKDRAAASTILETAVRQQLVAAEVYIDATELTGGGREGGITTSCSNATPRDVVPPRSIPLF